jgi:hypothetical protein
MWRERFLTVLMVPVLVLPLLVIAAGGDLGILWREVRAFAGAPIVLMVQAQVASPTVGPSPTVTMLASPTMTRGPGAPHEAPVLARWGYISASIVLALIAAWSIAERAGRRGRPR